MSSLSVMECNVKTPLQWDWENLFMFNTTTTEVPRKLQTTEWEIDGDGGMDSLSVYSSGPGGYGGGSGSDLGHASLSKSSKSPSINSSSLEEGKGARFTLDAFEGITDNFSSKKENAKIEPTRTSTIGTSAGSGEPLLGLKLGKRTYFEDVCAATHTKSSSNSIIAPSSVTLAKRSKSSFQTSHVPRCQVEGCNLDLSSAKDYHRKHRVCENHSKSPKVVVGGLERRFCQQCSRFHGLAEFDEKKRSCRRRLSDHNARRRKPQTEAVHFNAARHSSSPYDGKQQMSFVWNTIPIFQARPSKNVAWDGTFDSKSTQLKGCNPSKVGNVNSQLQPPAGNPLLNSIMMHTNDSNEFLPLKAMHSIQVLNEGVEESAISTNVGGSQDLHRALSLLSTDSWGSCESKHGSLEYSVHANPSSISQPVMHAISQGFPHAFSGTWQSDQQSSQGHATLQGDGNNHFQEFQLLKAPFENGFYSNQMN